MGTDTVLGVSDGVSPHFPASHRRSGTRPSGTRVGSVFLFPANDENTVSDYGRGDGHANRTYGIRSLPCSEHARLSCQSLSRSQLDSPLVT
jgi:hypothetical protein